MVAAGFTLRKIRGSQTLGEKLRRARKRKGVDLVEAELSTKVRAKYLEALETEDFEVLPNDIYVRGFLTTYANYLGLPAKEMLALYKQQKLIFAGGEDQTFSTAKPIKERSFVITPKILVIFTAVVFVFSAIFYIVFQVYSFAAVPKLLVFSPQRDSVVYEEKVSVAGQTDPGASLTVNNELVSVDNAGNFDREVELSSGLNTIVISVTNKAKKETSKTLIIERKIKTAENNSIASQ